MKTKKPVVMVGRASEQRRKFYKRWPLGVGVGITFLPSSRVNPGGGIELGLRAWDDVAGVEIRKDTGVSVQLGMSVELAMAAVLKQGMMEMVKLHLAKKGMPEPVGMNPDVPPVGQETPLVHVDFRPEMQMGISNPDNEMGATRP